MTDTDPQDADIPAYAGQDRPADPGAEAMHPGDDDVEVASPSQMAGHEPLPVIDDTAEDPTLGGNPSPS